MDDDVTEVVAQFLAEYRYGGSRKTLAHYQYHIGTALLPFLLERQVVDVHGARSDVLREFIGQSAERLAPSTLRKRHEAMCRFFSWCTEQELLEASPMTRVRRPRLTFPLRRGFDPEEVRRMVAVSDAGMAWVAARGEAILVTLLGTGARASELLAMTLDCIHWGTRERPARILLHGKGSRDRWVPMGRNTAVALERYLSRRPANGSSSVWLSQRRGPLE